VTSFSSPRVPISNLLNLVPELADRLVPPPCTQELFTNFGTEPKLEWSSFRGRAVRTRVLWHIESGALSFCSVYLSAIGDQFGSLTKFAD